ncbi:putative fatty-acid-CoA ligase FadD [Nocardia neocaledoniensis NBRC 108232]|uniref:Fatty-acyl-CoA synthase n=1 Tax=Nocardia neocaledoniensis TaxID=236511 RepID=A0A317NHI1_9NOCA|nr:AMP-binding protein [Nocardia neocaledoniensis]PWV74257.1 fatty-acyl-CoA synthase [Nocardia neocaledoniensis]GEM33964.1 putative fatty-acid-CoA ligase FadD [Nocardia neocaledoniensis NBRC 108232]
MTSPFASSSVAELLLARAEDDHPALLFGDDVLTWRAFVAAAAHRATVLTELRRPGPWHVGVLMDNDPEYLLVIAAAALCGATVVGVNPTRRGAELAADIRGTDCRTLLVGASHRALLDGLDLPDVEVIDAEGERYRTLVDDSAAYTAPPPAGLGHTLLLLFTSGSTGAPKAVICSSFRLAAIGQLNVHGLTREDVAYNAMPLFHGNALMAAWAPILAVGGTYAMRPRFSASGFRPDVRRFGATFFNYVGRALSYVLAQPEHPDEADNRLRFGFGTEASTRDREEFQRRFGCRIVESYGSSEGVCTILRTESTPPGALGTPDPAMGLEIVGAEGQPCPAAEFGDDGRLRNAAAAIGEIVVRGAAARFEGYYNNPGAMADKVRDGDYWTGDLAYRDAEGTFWFAGRSSDWIRVDSENFTTAPIERILARHPAVATAVVYGVPDPRTGDEVMAALLPLPGHTLDPAELREFLAAQPDLGTKWRPRLVRVVADLPLTGTGKLDKQTLRRQAWLTDDPLLLATETGYRPFTAADRADREAAFAAHGRRALLP